MHTLSVRLDDQTDLMLRAFCLRTGLSKTEAVKSAIAALTAQTPSPASLAASLELVGCCDSGVGDLGRNHSQRLREKSARQSRHG